MNTKTWVRMHAPRARANYHMSGRRNLRELCTLTDASAMFAELAGVLGPMGRDDTKHGDIGPL